jgi:hypothetical protein
MEMEIQASSKRKREFEFETPQKKTRTQMMSQTMPRMPRSAMKPQFQPRTPATAIKKNVTFNQDPLTASIGLNPQFGYAGDYKGSIFENVPLPPFSSSEASPSTPSTISETDSSQVSFSPTTKSNTNANTPDARMPTFADPHNPYWTPRPHNPRPGQFCLPDEEDMEYYDDESMIERSTTPTASVSIGGNTPATPETIGKGRNAVFPESPETPRPSHAQLPGSAAQTTPAVSSFSPAPQHSHTAPSTTESLFADAGTDAVTKARAAAEKYKPASVGKQASKLSQVTSARSRSSSPPASAPGTPSFTVDITQDKESAAQSQDGNTIDLDYMKECEEWAANLDWPKPGEKIVEDEIFNSDMMKHIVKEWTEEDEEQNRTFWDREYDRVIEAGRRAEREGKVLMFV